MASNKRDRSPFPFGGNDSLRSLPDARWMCVPSAAVTLKHSVQHEVLPQIVGSEVVSTFMPNEDVVARTPHDERCCVGTLTFIALDSLTAEDMKFIARFPRLSSLGFGAGATTPVLAEVVKCGQERQGFTEIAQHTQLECIDADHYYLDAASLAEISKINNLRGLSFRRCMGVTAAKLAHITALTQLRSINLRDCPGVDSEVLAVVAKLKQLTVLNLHGCAGVDGEGLAHVWTLTQLTRLVLARCRGIDAAGLTGITALTQLVYLDLSRCPVDTAALAHVAKLPQLRRLSLERCHGVDASGVTELAKLPHLHTVQLYRCEKVCAEDLRLFPPSVSVSHESLRKIDKKTFM